MAKERNTKNSSGVVLGRRERRLLSEAVQVDEELVPAFVRPALVMIAVLVLGFIVWASLTKLSEVAHAPGEVIPSGQVKNVQHLDGGQVASILVEEGSRVEKDQVLLTIDNTQAQADLRQMESRLLALQLRAERLNAFSENRKPDFASITKGHADLVSDQREIYLNQLQSQQSTLDILDRQVDQKKQRLGQLAKQLSVAQSQQKLSGELLSLRQELAAKRLITRVDLLQTQQAKVTADGEVARLSQEADLVEQEMAEVVSRREDTQNQLRRDALAELGSVGAEMAEVQETLVRLQARFSRQDVRAPVTGTIQSLTVVNVGQVVQPGALLMQVVPEDAKLECEVRINTRDIAYVQEGQAVEVRVSAYDFSRYGTAKGVLHRISATSVVDAQGQPYFKGWVGLKDPYVGDVPGRYPIRPGMGVEAEILTGEKSLIAYLIKPVVRALESGFRER
jgi:HlyD family type I secretion membrane fusion protein